MKNGNSYNVHTQHDGGKKKFTQDDFLGMISISSPGKQKDLPAQNANRTKVARTPTTPFMPSARCSTMFHNTSDNSATTEKCEIITSFNVSTDEPLLYSFQLSFIGSVTKMSVAYPVASVSTASSAPYPSGLVNGGGG